MDLGLETRTQRDELGPVTHELTQLARRRRCHPRLRETTQAQQVDEIRRVAFIVLHPPMTPIVAEGGAARCTGAPCAVKKYAAQYQPYVASSTTSVPGPAFATSSANATGSLSIRTMSTVSPASVRRTITDRRRCRSIPTYCRSTGASLPHTRNRFGETPSLNDSALTGERRPRSFITSRSWWGSQILGARDVATTHVRLRTWRQVRRGCG